ncbi:hypothetical protein Mapa_004837 [Marchantia paleacea]|nr:hypothetical protein Mapa_004837 [Marchantia paleacea]
MGTPRIVETNQVDECKARVWAIEGLVHVLWIQMQELYWRGFQDALGGIFFCLFMVRSFLVSCSGATGE